ncbi:hypothetical protein BO78DRAFT_33452 [Aspergillus sclerotiicarbonarius CBS 121057]|uniref:Uncharacterized protein n=1 Tax=Aspergillus sclerotiicarbonarius (strain CBS 121057 / IBT 28362) TaxID=1448318 RepID=A0A319E2V9_ASPSB|nr:hypothetical protein BO78DRAFT_33452 [Aspergillus sclerotiicarbonarius CBS 121057]
MENPEARFGYRMHQLGHQIRQRKRSDAWIVRSVVQYGRLGLSLESASPNQAPDMIHTHWARSTGCTYARRSGRPRT